MFIPSSSLADYGTAESPCKSFPVIDDLRPSKLFADCPLREVRYSTQCESRRFFLSISLSLRVS